MSKKNIFIIGLDDFNKEKLERLPRLRSVIFMQPLTLRIFVTLKNTTWNI